jgi:selenocysteine-specific elongation factor
VIVLTKRDLVDDETLEIARLDIADHVAGTFLAAEPIVAVSAPSGAELDELRAALDDLVARTPPAPDRGRARLWIDRVFAAKGSGTVVTGTLTDGSIRRDDQLVVEPGARPARVRGIQTLGAGVDVIAPGNRVALNLGGVAQDDLHRGDCVVTPGRWRTSDRFDATLDVLATLGHEVSRRGAYMAYVGSRELPVRLRLLSAEALAPGRTGTVRVFLPVPLPMLPGDRYVLRESGRDETIGGGAVLDIAPVTKASQAAPDGTVERAIAERGWVDVGELELLTGVAVEPAVGHWATTPAMLEATRERLYAAVEGAGEHGVDTAALAEHERAVVLTLDGVVMQGGRARLASAGDPYADHPVAAEIRRGGMSPDAPPGADRATIRELTRRGILVERDGVLFHRDSIDDAAALAAELVRTDPAGFTVATFRERAGVSRKYALPLLAELDARGITRRRDDLRIAGPRLPGV